MPTTLTICDGDGADGRRRRAAMAMTADEHAGTR